MKHNAKAIRPVRGKGRIPMAVPIAAVTAGLAMLAGLAGPVPAASRDNPSRQSATSWTGAGAAVVSGSMVYRDGSPAAHRQLHFQNAVTGDMFVAPTQPGGEFMADLPPGQYDLRAERGAILKDEIAVGNADRNVGQVVEPARYDPRRLFQLEGVASTVLEFAAPSAANTTGRPIAGMRHGHEAIAAMTAPATPAPKETPLGEAPAAAPTPSSAIE